MKAQKLLSQLLVSSLVLSSTVGFFSPAQAQVEDDYPVEETTEELTTVFRCVREGNNFATIAERGERTTAPIISWRTTEFGPEYTPQNRCRIVSDRLSRAVDQNGGRLSNLYITTGTLNRLPVVCYVNNNSTGCNSQNLLLTLDSRNARNPDAVLDSLFNFGVSGSGSTILSLRPSNSTTPRRRSINLERVVDEAFNSARPTRPNRPTPNTRPGTRPVNPNNGF